jgi:PmbA protein
MMDHISASDLLEKISPQVDGAELYELRSLELPVHFRAGTLESVKALTITGRALRIIKDGRLGFTTTTDLADDTSFLENAAYSARTGDPASFTFPSQQPSHSVQCYDPHVEKLDEGDLIALAEEIVDRINAYEPELQIEVFVKRKAEELHLFNTNGLELHDRRTALSLLGSAMRVHEGDILEISHSATSRRSHDVDAHLVADRIIERFTWAEKTATVPSKSMPVIFSPQAAIVLFLPLMFGLNGRYAYLGASPLSQKINHGAFDRQFSLIDNGRLDFAVRSQPFDDEGTPTTEKPLIDRGTVRQFLYDLKTAAQAETNPTGNGIKGEATISRDFRKPPTIAPTSWIVPPGDRSVEQILQDQEEAILVDDVIGLGQGNMISGEFSNTISVGYLFRRGQLIGRVKNTMIAGNVYDLLKGKLIGLSDQAEWAYGVLYSPAIAVDGVSVVSKG